MDNNQDKEVSQTIVGGGMIVHRLKLVIDRGNHQLETDKVTGVQYIPPQE